MNIKDIISIQENIGIDTYTNGEVGRENYIHFLLFCFSSPFHCNRRDRIRKINGNSR